MQDSGIEYHLEKKKKRVSSTSHQQLLHNSIAIMLAMIANSGQPVSAVNAVKIGGGIKESTLQRFL